MPGGKGKSSGGKSSGGKTSAEGQKKQMSHSERAGLQVSFWIPLAMFFLSSRTRSSVRCWHPPGARLSSYDLFHPATITVAIDALIPTPSAGDPSTTITCSVLTCLTASDDARRTPGHQALTMTCRVSMVLSSHNKPTRRTDGDAYPSL